MVKPDAYYTIAELSERIGGSDRLYRGEIAKGRLAAVYTGRWFVLGADALAWAAARGERRHGRGRPVATRVNGAASPDRVCPTPSSIRKEDDCD